MNFYAGQFPGLRRFLLTTIFVAQATVGLTTAYGQVINFDTSANNGLSITPGGEFTLEFHFTAEGITTENFVVIGWEIHGFPADTAVKTSPVSDNCELALSVSPDVRGGPLIDMQRPFPIILNPGEPDASCNPATARTDEPFQFTLEVIADFLDVPDQFPARAYITFVYPDDAPLVEQVELVIRYRVGSGPEINNEGSPNVIVFADPPPGCASTQGDADGSGSVTPGDAQQAFEYFLGVTQNLAVSCVQCDGDAGGQITPGDAQAIFDVFLGARPMCDGSNAPIDDTPEN